MCNEMCENCNKVYYVKSEPEEKYAWCHSSFENCVEKYPEPKMYLSGDFNLNGIKVYIRQVIYSNPATIVLWNDGTKTVSKCSNGDIYSKETGLAICILKKLVGGVKVHDVFEDWIIDDKEYVTIKDVRKNKR